MAPRRFAVPLIAALLVAGAATAFALGSSRNVKAYSGSSWKAAVRPSCRACLACRGLTPAAPPHARRPATARCTS